MNKIILILVIILAIFVVGSILLVSILTPQKKTEPANPVIQANITPASSTIIPKKITALQFISVSPTEDTSQAYLPVKQIFFSFNEPMNPITFHIQTSPETQTIATLKPEDPNTVVISPQNVWPQGITTITVLPSTVSAANNKLNQPFVYKINTKFPENPPPDSPGL